MKLRTTRIELFKENFKFSSGHFTLFSASERENIHGHNFTVYAAFDILLESNGMAFDYAVAKRHIEKLCRSLNEKFLVPERSQFLKLEHGDEFLYLHFHTERIPFLPRDVLLLPLENITVEELAYYFLTDCLQHLTVAHNFPVEWMEIRVFSNPGQSANASWSSPDPLPTL